MDNRKSWPLVLTMLESAKKLVKHSVIRYMLWRDGDQMDSAGDSHHGLPPDLFGCGVNERGALTIDGLSVEDLVRDYGTPLQVLSERQLHKSKNLFLDCFEAVYPNVVLATSYKTNPVPHVLRLLHDAGTHAEVISHFELWLALELGLPPEKIILNGPGKGDDALRLAVDQQIDMINIDGPEEIEKIAQFAAARGVTQRVGVRVTTSVGWSSQFGLSILSGAAEEAFAKIAKYPQLDPCGLHLHLGTGIQSVSTYVQAVTELVEFSHTLKSSHDISISVYDLGGGFGVPTVRTMTDWDVRMMSLGYTARLARPDQLPRPADYAKALKPLFEEIKELAQGSPDLPRVVFEPGRAITSNSQVLLLSVIGQKNGVGGERFLYVDGGKNVAMPLGWEVHQIFPASQMNSVEKTKYDVFGPLCHPGDVVMKNMSLPRLEEGDCLAVMDAGAYFIPNQMNFSNPRPAVVAIDNGQHSLVRRPEEFGDIVRLDSF